MKKTKVPQPIRCEDCIHFGACSAWNRGAYLNATAQRCINFERLRDSAVYYIATRETAKKFAEMARAKARWMRDHHGDYTAIEIDDIDEIAKEITEGVK